MLLLLRMISVQPTDKVGIKAVETGIILLIDPVQCTEVRLASFLPGGFITAMVVNPPERKLAKRTSVQWQL